jgi:hypothetical protein
VWRIERFVFHRLLCVVARFPVILVSGKTRGIVSKLKPDPDPVAGCDIRAGERAIEAQLPQVGGAHAIIDQLHEPVKPRDHRQHLAQRLNRRYPVE